MNDKVAFLINPFHRIAGWTALIVGLLIQSLTTWIAWKGGVVFDSIFSIHYANVSIGTAYLYQAVNWLMLAIVLYAAAQIFSSSRIRVIDALGTMALAKAPLLLVTCFAVIPFVRDAMLSLVRAALTQNLSEVNLFLVVVFVALSALSIIWFVILAYNGFKVFGNVRRPKTIPVFIVALILAEALVMVFHFTILRPDALNAVKAIEQTQKSAEVQGELISGAMALTPDQPLYAIAKDAADYLCSKEYVKLTDLFDETMKQNLPPAGLSATMRGIRQAMGEEITVETTFMMSSFGEHTLVFIPLNFPEGKLTLQLAFDKEQKVAGLFLKPLVRFE